MAKVAGMPTVIVKRAETILSDLEINKSKKGDKKIEKDQTLNKQQLSFFQLDDPILSDIRNEIENLDIDSLTPVEALILLNEIKKKLGS